ncbi:Pre-mRNA-processing factor 17 [Smittium mucronatum]|uniref:Pre-mRNA-processing factor 17 n=1 Tax=Smittium mucronatum TaxID=133383 RepID=A0A1R0GLI9_9FUNG|nr:Pre-mRNA-processing factor 17 [Smittium mucronatum]OLY77763.1 Pre-mRNA-processing factor 17 [Smittium mucronatum]
MSLVGEYYSSEDEIAVPQKPKRFKVDIAPDVGLEEVYLKEKMFIAPKQMEIPYNIPYDVLSQQPLGPKNHLESEDYAANTITGVVDEQSISEHDFRIQERSFRTLGYALNPSEIDNSSKYIGNSELAIELNGANTFSSLIKNNTSLKRMPKGDPTISKGEGSYVGPWAGYEGETIGENNGPTEEEMTEWNAKKQLESSEDQNIITNKSNPQTITVENSAGDGESGQAITTEKETTTFHGDSERDYQGRTYMQYPRDLDDVNINFTRTNTQDCYAPKRCIHQFTAHPKGVSAIKYLPKTGHLLLSSGMDGQVKLWDCYHSRSLLRTFSGHSKAVRDISFDSKTNGAKFLSTSYDRFVKLWDTETGQCVSRFTTGKIPYVSRIHPIQNNLFLVGQNNKKIIQYDMRTRNKVQEYDEHLGAISTITFVDEGRRFVSTSDDKTMRAWEFGIPVVIKLIADPSMHSIPAVSVHPSKKWIACQSLDNQILVWSCTDKFRQNKKKEFSGHLVAGYACQMGFSPDGKFLASGDSEGKVWFWDWKTTRVFRKFQAHKAVTIGVEWSPVETSKVATCSWDGTIKYWD